MTSIFYLEHSGFEIVLIYCRNMVLGLNMAIQMHIYKTNRFLDILWIMDSLIKIGTVDEITGVLLDV